ncbi:MAG: hypothetical protein R2713_02355 [Ilumatobacteraceae bacterium]
MSSLVADVGGFVDEVGTLLGVERHGADAHRQEVLIEASNLVGAGSTATAARPTPSSTRSSTRSDHGCNLR